jgi:hypothetical protein
LSLKIDVTCTKQPGEHNQGFEPRDIVTQATGEKLAKGIEDFNQGMSVVICTDEDENYDDMIPTSITALEEIEQINPLTSLKPGFTIQQGIPTMDHFDKKRRKNFSTLYIL